MPLPLSPSSQIPHLPLLILVTVAQVHSRYFCLKIAAAKVGLKSTSSTIRSTGNSFLIRTGNVIILSKIQYSIHYNFRSSSRENVSFWAVQITLEIFHKFWQRRAANSGGREQGKTATSHYCTCAQSLGIVTCGDSTQVKGP